MKKIVCTFSFVLFLVVSSFGQIKRQREYSGFFDTYYFRGPISYTLGAGLSTYRGDLANAFSAKGLSYAISLGANYKLWPHTVFGIEFSYIGLACKDDQVSRNISFTGSGFEFQGYGRLYLIDEIIRVAQDRRRETDFTFCKPYIHLGAAGFIYGAKTQINDPSYLLRSNQDLENISYSRLAFAVPAGFGLQFNLDLRSSICVDYIYRFTLTDYIDGVSLLGNSSNYDGYGALMVKFQFAPSGPKNKKKQVLQPPAQYTGPKGTETWKTRKQQEQQNKPQQEEYVPVPTDEDTNGEGDGEIIEPEPTDPDQIVNPDGTEGETVTE